MPTSISSNHTHNIQAVKDYLGEKENPKLSKQNLTLAVLISIDKHLQKIEEKLCQTQT